MGTRTGQSISCGSCVGRVLGGEGSAYSWWTTTVVDALHRAFARNEGTRCQAHQTFPQGGVYREDPMPFNVPTRPPLLKQICRQHEKPLVLQLCRLVRGFTHPASYFAGNGNPSSTKNRRHSRGTDGGNGDDLALFSVDEFSAEMVRVIRAPQCLNVMSNTSSGPRRSARGHDEVRPRIGRNVGIPNHTFVHQRPI